MLVDYKCDQCDHVKEIWTTDVHTVFACDKCAAGTMRKVISATPVHFKGKGWTR